MLNMVDRSAAVRPSLGVVREIIPAARPRLPGADAVLPYLRRMDDSRQYSNFGPLLREFEARLAIRFEAMTQVVTCVNATQALTLTLQALDLPKGSLVAMPAYTFVASAHAVIAAGLTPWFLDVDGDDWMLRPETVRNALATAPGPVSAVMPVAAFGAMPDLDAWKTLRDDTGLAVVLDAAAAFDQAQDADLPTIVSLHATKVLGIGEGGFLATRDADLAARVRQLTTYGFQGSRISEIAATNAKLSEYASAVGLAALDNWDADRLHFLHAARSMRAAMTFLPQVRFQPGWGIDWITSVCSVQLPDGAADAVEHALEALDIQTRRWWSEGCQTNPAFADCPRQDLSVTNVLGHSVIGLPFAIDMDDRDISRVAATLATALAGL
jgi:dTDP-4-amino-4,6-dideoxygalactose transaminase